MTLLAPPPYQTPQKPFFSKGKMLTVVIAGTLLLHGGIALFALLYKAKLPPPVKKEVSIRLGPRKKTKVLAEVGKTTKTAGRGTGGSSAGTAPAKQPPGPLATKADQAPGLSAKDKEALLKKLEVMLGNVGAVTKTHSPDPGKDFDNLGTGSSAGAGGGTSLTQTKGTEGTGTVQGNGTLTTSGPRDGVGTGSKRETQLPGRESPDVDHSPTKDPADAQIVASVKNELSKKKVAFNNCYGSALKRNPSAKKETLLLVMSISGGKVLSVSFRNAEDLQTDKSFITCMQEYILSIKFPGISAAKVEYPIRFQADR